MEIYSNNDWSPLQEIIVGRADNALIPYSDLSVRNFMYAKLSLEQIKKYVGKYSDRIIDETNEDLEDLCNMLKTLGVIVHRPVIYNHQEEIKTSEWTTTGWSNYCPRDILLILGKNVIEIPSPMRSRIFEAQSYHHILYSAFKDGAKWFSAPRPKISDDCFQFDDLSVPTLTNTEILFDAPNVVRLNEDLIFQVSNSGNLMGYQWLSTMFPEYNIHLEKKAYSGAHMDSTIIPLREGLVLFNGHRIKEDRYPKIFQKWDKIFFNDIADSKTEEIGISTGSIGLNLLSINEKLVIVDENQKQLIQTLKKYNIESIPMKLRHARTLGGGFHCVTLDLKRK